MKINAGSGIERFHIKNWVNVDILPACKPDLLLNMGADPWPWPDSSAGSIRADNLLEHFDKDEDLHFMNEAWRVLVPGGRLWLRVPNSLLWWDGAAGDPTHKRYFTPKSFQYFDVICPTHQNYGRSYGYKSWSLVENNDFQEMKPFSDSIVTKAFFERIYRPVK